MTDRDDLIKIILTDNVSYDEACRIADNIMDAQWRSPEDIRLAREHGFSEAITSIVNMHEQYRMENDDLLVEEFDQEKMDAVYRDMEVGGVTTYSQLTYHLASRWHGLLAGMVRDTTNPFSSVAKKVRKR